MSPHVAWQLIDGEAVLIDLEKGQALGLNEAGSFIWKRLSESSGSDLAEQVAAEFEVEIEQARHDVEGFLASLRARGFIH